jgi:hypothetical protein
LPWIIGIWRVSSFLLLARIGARVNARALVLPLLARD